MWAMLHFPGCTWLPEVYEVLQYHKSPRYKDLLPVLGSQSMVMSEGHVWKAQRDAFNPGFSSSFLKTALPGFISCTEHLVQRLEAAADQREVVQLHHLTVLTTLEVICKVSVDLLSI
jgi:cytochrome P450